jgi:adenylate cyclase
MSKKLPYLVVAGLIGVLVSLSFAAGLFTGPENRIEDLLFSQSGVHPDIVIVAIDNESIERIGQWPWPRAEYAGFFRKLNEVSPKAVALDVIFSEPSRQGAADDNALVNSLRSLDYPVVFPVELPNSAPIDLFSEIETVTLGHVNLIVDGDGVVRRFERIADTSENGQVEAFALQTLRRAGAILDAKADAEDRIVYTADAGTIRHIPFWRVVEEDASAQLQGKVIFVGSTASDLHDEQITPLGTLAGVEIQATIANMFLSDIRINPLSGILSILWIFVAALIPGLLFLYFEKSLKPIFISIVIGAVYILFIIVLFESGVAANFIHISLSWILSVAALFGYRYFVDERERRQLTEVFGKYVSQSVLDGILDHPDKVSLGGEERTITLLFSDIRSFTTLSERLTPTELVRVLNLYFNAMTEEILKHGGVLDKYIGDAIMAFWGAPLDDPNQADNALKAGMGMVERLAKLNAEFKAAGDSEIHIGIGLYTGMAVVGNIGAERRFDYTAIGDTVNVASRLEGLTKEYKTPLILGEYTKDRITIPVEFRTLGNTAVKGRSEPLNIYTVYPESV